MSNKSIINDKKYLEYTYSDTAAPPSEYPKLFAKWLLDTVYNDVGTIGDFGCGRGDYLKEFQRLGFTPHGFDISPNISMLSDFNVKQIDFANDKAPYTKEKFDFIFSKSVVEHLREPSTYLTAIHKSLKDGGKAVVMTPSWKHTHWGPFYIDHTHVTPFTKHSLKAALEMAEFKNVSVQYFYQLPILWKYSWLTPAVQLLAKLPLPFAPYNDVPWSVSNSANKLIRFSKEVMLMAVVEK